MQTLQWWNGVRIDHRSRYAAYQYAKQPKLIGCVSMALWNSALNDESVISAMATWQPASLTALNLSKLSLLALHCSPLSACVNLTSLDVSGNHLTSLQHSGLHLLTSLMHIDLSDNELNQQADCKVFGHLPNLRSLALHGNEGLLQARLYVIACCRG